MKTICLFVFSSLLIFNGIAQPVPLSELDLDNRNLFSFKGDLLFSKNNELVRYKRKEGSFTALKTGISGINIRGILDERYVYFTAKNEDKNYLTELYCTDGTIEGTQWLGTFRSIDNFISLKNTMYFIANDGEKGRELWKSTAGKNAGLVIDLNKGKDSFDNSKNLLAATDNFIFFRTKNNLLGKSDGTESGTEVIGHFKNLGLDVWISGLKGLEKDLYFMVAGFDSKQWFRDVWKWDADNGVHKVKTIDTYPVNGKINGFTRGPEGYIYFFHYYSYYSELWRTDGTEEGTVKLKKLGEGVPYMKGIFKDKLIFYTLTEDSSYELWTSDGTVNGTSIFRSFNGVNRKSFPLAFYKGKMFFVDSESKADFNVTPNSHLLWETDLTEEGTLPLKVKYPKTGELYGNVFHLVVSGDELFFTSARKGKLDDKVFDEPTYLYLYSK